MLVVTCKARRSQTILLLIGSKAICNGNIYPLLMSSSLKLSEIMLCSDKPSNYAMYDANVVGTNCFIIIYEYDKLHLVITGSLYFLVKE